MNKFLKVISEPLFWVMSYFWMFIFTFGSAYAAFPKGYTSWGGSFIEYGIFEKCIGSFFASIGWPLYWSVKLWS